MPGPLRLGIVLLVMLSAVVLPGTALAAAPSASTSGVDVTGPATAMVSGVLNPGGELSSYYVGYDVASSAWCASGGSSGTAANSTSPDPLSPTAATNMPPYAVELTGLTPATRYCAAFIVTNGSGTAVGNTVSWTQGAPSADTGLVQAGASGGVWEKASPSERVEGRADPHGQSGTYYAVYDLASSPWCESGGASGSPAYSTSPRALSYTTWTPQTPMVAVTIAGLSKGTEYCAALAVANASGTTFGKPVSFTTLPAFTVRVLLPSRLGPTSATLRGAVQIGSGGPAGATVSWVILLFDKYHALHGAVPFCVRRAGRAPKCEQTGSAPATQGTVVFSSRVTGLRPGTTYLVMLVSFVYSNNEPYPASAAAHTDGYFNATTRTGYHVRWFTTPRRGRGARHR